MTPTDTILSFCDPRHWQPYVRHDPDERTYEVLHRDDEVEVYVVCWMPGHDTGFHDHDDSAAAILVVEGEIVDERLGVLGTTASHHGKGALLEVAPEAIHSVRHAGDAPAVTLHAYSPPLHRMGVYETAPDGSLLRFATDAGQPLIAAGS